MSATSIQSFPVELICEIFEHVCRENCISRTSTIPAVTLNLVCFSWHHVAQNYATLWSNISLSLDTNYFVRQAQSKSMTLLLKHSRQALLNVEILDFSLGGVPDYPALTMLTAESHRWKHLRLRLMSCRAIPTQISAIRRKVPNLESLDAIILSTESEVDMFDVAPNLRHVCLSSRVFSSIPWFQISRLHLSSVDIGAVIETLAQCSVLEELTVEDMLPEVMASSPPGSALTTERENLLTLVRHIQIPSLRYMQVDDKEETKL
ncbi:hypothetical protein C8J56DRAFT_1080018 [Mycena floridula]|nr:hypothetical protein C8J56DRAFT_1080018 [Mycena floridula]